MPILSKVDAKMMSAELPLSTRTLWIVLLATTTLITSGSSWGCWQPSMSESEKVMVVSSRGSLDTTCISNVSPDLMLRRWGFLAELDSLPLQILRRSHGSLLRAASAELGLVDEVVVVAPGPDLLKPHNVQDAHVGSGTQFLSLAGCSHRFGVHDPCGTHSIWYCLFLLGLTSSEIAIS